METFFLILAGLLFGGIGGYLFWNEWQFFKRAIRVPGVVVDYVSQPGSEGGTVYAPIAAFEFDGEQRRVTSSMHSSSKPKIGKRCIVGVDPNNIYKARIYSKWNYVFHGLFLVIGIGLLIFGVFRSLPNF